MLELLPFYAQISPSLFLL